MGIYASTISSEPKCAGGDGNCKFDVVATYLDKKFCMIHLPNCDDNQMLRIYGLQNSNIDKRTLSMFLSHIHTDDINNMFDIIINDNKIYDNEKKVKVD